jgi:hypothetical protein
MVVNQFKIENLSNGKGLKFHSASRVGDALSIKNVDVAFGGQSNQNYSRNFGGFSRIISVDFRLNNDGTDKSTDASNIITLSQQEDYLMGPNGVMQGKDAGDIISDVKFRLTLYEDGATKTITGGVSEISIDGSSDDANHWLGSLNIFEGAN